MTNAGKKHVGRGAQGKGSGSGGMTDIPKDKIPENMVLSNRDKSQHTKERGQDGRQIQTDQFQDHVGSRLPKE
ncbi:MAG TPA: hypothetical protein VNS34_08665 [Rhizobiaceae bacterium]|nr:hypothetical protein [Rhizobiaceae bacterium]